MPSLPAPFCIHIGLPKTATTMLQRRCFPQHNQIDYLGSHQSESDLIGHRYRSQAARDLLEPIMVAPQEVTAESSREKLEEVLSAAGGRVPLWSREGLSIHTREWRRQRAEALRRAIGDCTIVVTLRNPVALAESAYFQYLKKRSTRLGQPWRRPLYWSADDWLKQFWVARGGLVHLDYKQTIDTFVDVFGRDSVKVLLFERLTKDFDSFVRSMFRAMGVDPNDLKGPIDSRRENDRWTTEQIERLQAIARNPLRALSFHYSGVDRKLRQLGLDQDRRPVRPGPKPRANFNEESLHYITKATAEANRTLAIEWDLPLDQYGYPMAGATYTGGARRMAA